MVLQQFYSRNYNAAEQRTLTYTRQLQRINWFNLLLIQIVVAKVVKNKRIYINQDN